MIRIDSKRITSSTKIALVCLCVYFVYILLARRQECNFVNMIIFLFSCFLLSYALIDIGIRGLVLSNLFLLTYFSVLALSNLNISNLQKQKNFVDLYYYFSGGLVFFAMLRLGEHLPKVHICLKQAIFSPNFVAIISILLLLIGKIIIFERTGIRILTNQWHSEQTRNFVVVNLSGFTGMWLWISLMLIPAVSWKLKIVIAILAFMFQAIDVSRGGIMRVAIYLILLWVANRGKHFLNKKNIIRILVLLLVFFLIFSILGNYRQMRRGWTENNSIGNSLQSITNIDMFNWVYSYTAFNFEVLKQEYIENEPTWEFKALLLPVMRLVYGSEAAAEYVSSLYTHGVHGFNAGTFLARFVRESGVFFVFSVGLLGIIVALLDWLCRMINFHGGHLLLAMLTALTIFGNYYLEPEFFFSLIGGIILFFVSCGKKSSEGTVFTRVAGNGNAGIFDSI